MFAVKELTIAAMQELQRTLQEKYKPLWGGLSPEKGMEKLLWLYGELGEVGDILKKKGTAAVMEDPAVRHAMVEELCDVLMYFNDVLLCYGITPEELVETYLKKQAYNMSRWKVPDGERSATDESL